jgi:hypothetical protein
MTDMQTGNRSDAVRPLFAKYLVEVDYPQVETDVKAGESAPAPPPIPHLTWPVSLDDGSGES